MSEFEEKHGDSDWRGAGGVKDMVRAATEEAAPPNAGGLNWSGGSPSATDIFTGLFDVDQAEQDVIAAPTDRALKPVSRALNDRKLSAGERAQIVLDYRNAQLPLLPPRAALAAAKNKDGFSLHAQGNAGLHRPLLDKLAGDPEAQAMMWELSARVLSTDPSKVDIDAIWESTRSSARARREKAGDLDGKDAQLDALRSMAALMQAGKMSHLPPALLKSLPPGLMEQMLAAHKALSASPSPDASVMSRGSPGVRTSDPSKPFSADHNYHFFSHAYLVASLMREHGLTGEGAEAMSAFAGAQYELEPHSIAEGSGNASLKDILMNAEGAAFGRDLMEGSGNAILPGPAEGPPLEDRSIPWLDRDHLPPDVDNIVKSARDVSLLGLLGPLFSGSAQRQVERDVEFQNETGMPPPPSPEGQ